jgi:predicted RNA-binding Zn ribbon-like protein
VETLMTCLSALGADSNRFLPPLIAAEEVGAARSLSTLTRAEYVDGDVYLLSHDGRRARTQHEESAQRQVAEALQIIVCSHLPGGDAVRSLPDWCSAELEVEAWLQTAAQSDDARRWEQNDVILRLRGEYFIFMFATTAGVREEKSLHSSFLHCELQRQAGILEVDDAGDLVWQATEQPDSSAANSIEDTESAALLLLRRYHKQALRLIRYRDHVLQQSRGTEHTENSADPAKLLEQASHSSCSTVSKEMTDGSTFTAILKHCATKQDAAPYLMSLANVPLNPHYDIGAWPVPLRVDDKRSYPADCVTQINSTFPDRTIIKFDLQTQVRSTFPTP